MQQTIHTQLHHSRPFSHMWVLFIPQCSMRLLKPEVQYYHLMLGSSKSRSETLPSLLPRRCWKEMLRSLECTPLACRGSSKSGWSHGPCPFECADISWLFCEWAVSNQTWSEGRGHACNCPSMDWTWQSIVGFNVPSSCFWQFLCTGSTSRNPNWWSLSPISTLCYKSLVLWTSATYTF